jgi:hypothetical protein
MDSSRERISMKTILIHTQSGSFLVMPDSKAYADGHPVLTSSYNIFKKEVVSSRDGLTPDELLTPQKNNNPNYLGYITFEQPGKLFTYTAGDYGELSRNELKEIIEQISHYRDSPQMWSF